MKVATTVVMATAMQNRKRKRWNITAFRLPQITSIAAQVSGTEVKRTLSAIAASQGPRSSILENRKAPGKEPTKNIPNTFPNTFRSPALKTPCFHL
jgi:hypothetical protein